MDIVIKELDDSEDHIQYCALLKQLTTINPNSFTYEDYQKQLFVIFSNPYHKIFIAKDDDQIIGTITLLVEPKIIHNLSAVGHIEDVVVDRAYRSRGIGKHLVLKAIDVAKKMGCYKIILDCSSNNVEFYQKCGFVEKDKQMALYLE